MKTTTAFQRSIRGLAAAALAVAVMIPFAPTLAADWAWSTAPGSANWNASNWTNSVTPGLAMGKPSANDVLYFGTSSQLALNNDYAAATAFNGINFNNNAAAFTFGGNSITLNGDITVGTNITSETINLGMALSASPMVTVNSGTLTQGGSISGPFGITKAGAGTLKLTAGNSFSGDITVSQGVLKTGTDTGALTGVLGNPNTAGRQITVSSGATLTFGNHDTFGNWAALPAVTMNINGTVNSSGGWINALGPVTFNGGVLAASDGYNNNGITAYVLSSGKDVTVTGAVSTISLSGANNPRVALRGSVLFNVLNGASLVVAGPLSNHPDNTVGALNKTGAGTLQLVAANTYSGGTRINAGTVAISNNAALGTASVAIASNCTVSALTSLSVANAYAISNGATALFDVGTGLNLTLSGPVSGPGGLTKTNSGTLTLSGVNTYTGATTVVAGGLVGVSGGSCSNSAVTVASGATNGVQVLTAGGRWVCSNLTYSAGATVLNFDFTTNAPSTTVAPLQVNGDLTLSGTLNITISRLTWFAAGVYPLAKYTGTLFGTPPTAAAALPFGVSASISNDVANTALVLVVTQGNVGAYTWDGTANNWNTTHWLPGSVVGPTAGTTSVLIASGTVSLPASDMFQNPAGSYWATTSSPAVFLNSGILKSANSFNVLWNLRMGGGTLLSDGGANYVAQAFQLAGTLTVANTGGSTAPSFINAVSGGNNGLNAVNVGGQGDTALTMNVGDVTGDAAADLIINPVLQNSGPAGAIPLVKTGAGTLALTAANTYSGGTRINAGTVAISNNAAFGTASVAIASNCTVTALSSLALANACVLSNGVARPFDVGAGRTLTLSGALSGPGGLTQANAGTLTLSGINTYSGNTAVNVGTLVGVTGGSCSNSAVSLAATPGNSAALGVSITDSAKQYTCPSLTVNNAGNGCTLDFNFGRQQPSASVAPLRVIGAATFTTTPAVTVELSGNVGAPGTQYPLMTWGSTSGTAPTAVTVTEPHAITAHLTVSGSTLYLVIDTTAITGPLRWATSPSGTWDTGTANWKDNAGTTAIYTETNGIGDLVVFDDKYVTADTTVTLISTVNPPNVTVSNTTYNYTLSGGGSIAGSTSLTKLGAGTLTLAAAGTHNTFQVNGGSVVVSTNLNVTGPNGFFYVGNGTYGNYGGIANCSGALTINNGASIVLTGSFVDNAVIGRDSGRGSVVQSGGLFQPGRTLYVGATSGGAGVIASYAMNGGTLDMGNNVLGICLALGGAPTGALNQTGGVITNVNTLQAGSLGTFGTGLYTLSGGRIVVGSGGITSPSGKYQIDLGGGTLGSSTSWASPLNMNLTNLNGSVTFDAAANMTNTLSGVLSGNGGLIKAGAGMLILSGTNTYAGTTVVSNGTLLLNGSITNCTVTVGTGATFGGAGTLRWQAGQTVTANGTLNISQLNLALGTAGRVPNGDWTVADYPSGTLTGASFASVSGLPPYAKLIYDTTAKKIILKNRSGGTLIRVM